MRKKIGKVFVDSGQLMICDPCYLTQYTPDNYNPEVTPDKAQWSYSSVCDMTVKQPGYGVVQDGLAVAFSSGWGDGCYEVFAEIEGGRVVEVTIVMR